MADSDDPLTIVTRVAQAGWDEHLHFGYEVFAELAGAETYTGLMALAVTGRRFEPAERAMLDDMAAVMTIAEPRIWPLKVSRLVASYGRTVPAALAGSLCFESELIGPWTAGVAARQLTDLRDSIGERDDPLVLEREALAWLDRHGRLVGYGVPFRTRDERVTAITRRVEARGRAALPHWQLSTRVWSVLREIRGLEPNISSALAAVGLDLGLTATELAPLTVALLHNIFWANAVEGAAQQPQALRRLPDDRVSYVGPPPRLSPRAQSTRSTRDAAAGRGRGAPVD